MTDANGDPKTSSQSQPASSEEQTGGPTAASQDGSARGPGTDPDSTPHRATQYSSGGRGQQRIKGIAESAVSAQAKAYNSVFEAVGAIIIAALMGWFADDYFGTKPRYLIIGVIIGFAAFVLRLMRMAKAYQEALEAGDHEQQQQQQQEQEQQEQQEQKQRDRHLDQGSQNRKESETEDR
jgi:F0F1-type ATP synthase assembly protein I